MTTNSNKQDGSEWLDEALDLITVNIMRNNVVDTKEAKQAILEHEQAAVTAAKAELAVMFILDPRRDAEFKQGEVG